jgi:hypothetical protein
MLQTLVLMKRVDIAHVFRGTDVSKVKGQSIPSKAAHPKVLAVCLLAIVFASQQTLSILIEIEGH